MVNRKRFRSSRIDAERIDSDPLHLPVLDQKLCGFGREAREAQLSLQ
jgi:hypothetical protein